MNTREVAKLLGVSTSTVKRWVKHLRIEPERNERGHYLFGSGDVEALKNIQEQVNKGMFLEDAAESSGKATRRGSIKTHDHVLDRLLARVNDLERQLEAKADAVTSYQLLQHRSEIDDLHDQFKALLDRLQLLEEKKDDPGKTDLPPIFEKTDLSKRKKKKNLIHSLFNH